MSYIILLITCIYANATMLPESVDADFSNDNRWLNNSKWSKSCENRHEFDRAIEVAYASSKIALNNLTPDHYAKFFGEYSPARYQRVQKVLTKLTDVLRNKEVKFDCYCSASGNENPPIAYVNPRLAWYSYTIHICPRYYQLNYELRATIIVHELTHFWGIGATKDYAYGPDSFQLTPDRQVYNADNYSWYVTYGNRIAQ